MKIRNVRSGIREEPDEQPPTPLWSHLAYWTYVLVLLSIVGLAIWYGFQEYVHFEGRGQVRVDQTVVDAHRDGHLQSFFVKAGDTVDVGDPLFRVNPGTAAACEPADQSTLRELRHQIEEDRLRLKQLREQRERVQNRIRHLREQSTLELRTDPTELRERKEEAFRIRQEIERLQKRQQSRQEETQFLEAQPSTDPECAPYTVSAPQSGRVSQMLHPPSTFVESGTSVLRLASRPVSAHVYTYLDTDLAEYIRYGDTLTVSLPDGTESRGVVQHTSSSALEFAQLKYDGYRSLSSQLLVRLAPVGPPTNRHWHAFDRMDVEVRGRIETNRLFAVRSASAGSALPDSGRTGTDAPHPSSSPSSTGTHSGADTTMARNWVLVTASFSDRTAAQSAANSLDEQLVPGLSVQVRLAAIGDSTHHRVTVGRFRSRRQAQSAQQQYALPPKAWPLRLSGASDVDFHLQ